MLKTMLCAAILLLLAAPAGAESLPAYPFLHVSGSAFRPVMPDIGALDFEIVVADADPAAARAAIDARVAEVQALMRQLDIDPDDATIREVRQGVRKDGPAASGAGAPVYELRCDVHVNVRNLGNWAALAGGLLGKPDLDGFASSFDIANADQVDGELLAEAIADARHRAGAMAAAEGRRVGAMMAATPGELKNLSTAMGLERGEFGVQRGAGGSRAQDVDRDMLLSIATLKLRQPVDVIFRLENAAPVRRQK